MSAKMLLMLMKTYCNHWKLCYIEQLLLGMIYLQLDFISNYVI